jgi:hypothetical protein
MAPDREVAVSVVIDQLLAELAEEARAGREAEARVLYGPAWVRCAEARAEVELILNHREAA